jgi:hypothetical protein
MAEPKLLSVNENVFAATVPTETKAPPQPVVDRSMSNALRLESPEADQLTLLELPPVLTVTLDGAPGAEPASG